jgi:hypothetical protein
VALMKRKIIKHHSENAADKQERNPRDKLRGLERAFETMVLIQGELCAKKDNKSVSGLEKMKLS